MLKIIIYITINLSLIACGNYHYSGSPTSNSETPTKMTNAGSVGFETIKKEILSSQCINCHTGRHSAYENYTVVKASVTNILARIQDPDPSRQMPLGRVPLSAEKVALFKQWVEDGSPQFATQQPTEKEPGLTVPDTKVIGFSQVFEKVLKPYNCTACHTQFNDYTTVYLNRGSIVSQVVSNQMPFPKRKGLKVQHVNDKDKKVLLDWVAQGAPESPGLPEKTIEPPKLNPTWISLRNNVFGLKCILCHNTFASRGGGKSQSFGTYTELRNWFTKNPTLFKFNKQNGEEPGLFLDAILRDPDDPSIIFSPMPLNSEHDDVKTKIPRITPEELMIIEQWINLKLPYNKDEI